MSFGELFGSGQHAWRDNRLSWDSTTSIVDFAPKSIPQPPHNNDAVESCPRTVEFDPSARDRPDQAVARSVAFYGRAKSDVNRRFQFDLQHAQLQPAIPAIANSLGQLKEDQPAELSDRTRFEAPAPNSSSSRPTAPSKQAVCHHGRTRAFSAHSSAGPASSKTEQSILNSYGGPDPVSDAALAFINRPFGDEAQVMPVAGSAKDPPRRHKVTSSIREDQNPSNSSSDMPQSRPSQQADDGQKESASSQKRDGSIASSSHSTQSRTSFDFSNIDRLAGKFKVPGVVRAGSEHDGPSLPNEKGFSIQVGSELYKLSGASIMSDGYLITPTDGRHFVKLFADAQFYRLPRLQSQLFESEIFVEVGNEHFRIPRDIFSAPGDTPNYFTLGFTVFFSSPGDVFPGLNPRGLLRPPAIHPPRIPNRSPKIFADLLHILRGYALTIQNEDHRSQLLKDARYYNLRGLEQKLIPHTITHNIDRQISEIVIRLQDIKPSQISISHDTPIATVAASSTAQPSYKGWVTYARPFIDETKHELILETSDPMLLNLDTWRLTLFGTTRSRITNLFQTIANKLNLPTTAPLGLMMMASEGTPSQPLSPGSTPLSEDQVKVRFGKDTHVILDGADYDFDGHDWGESEGEGAGETPSVGRPLKRRRENFERGHTDKEQLWALNRSQWRLRIHPRVVRSGRSDVEIVMVAVKIDATSDQKARNVQRGFLSMSGS
ncbi:MAG: hypothetical protein Q9218_003736 [Villophora microphyllina]